MRLDKKTLNEIQRSAALGNPQQTWVTVKLIDKIKKQRAEIKRLKEKEVAQDACMHKWIYVNDVKQCEFCNELEGTPMP